MDTLVAMSGLVTDATNQEVCLQHPLWQQEHLKHMLCWINKKPFNGLLCPLALESEGET